MGVARSDAVQKHVHMKLQPGTLLTTGMFSHIRNVNYFGELLQYGSATGVGPALLAMHV